MTGRPRRRDRRLLGERPAARPMAPVDKPRARTAGEFEDRVLACLRAAGRPVTADELAVTLDAGKRHVALALGTLRMARRAELDRVAGVNYWSAP